MLTKTLSSADQLSGSGNSNYKAAACFTTQMRHKVKKGGKVVVHCVCGHTAAMSCVLSGASTADFQSSMEYSNFIQSTVFSVTICVFFYFISA